MYIILDEFFGIGPSLGPGFNAGTVTIKKRTTEIPTSNSVLLKINSLTSPYVTG